ncbi:conserved hypothetical protein [Treponema phagedenis]|uniref:Uncharacterized protein n=1 Tax=Treponema phagedenis TaxID=162 RepID=A0A0B7H003_TREPH|nr:conserved hypothetical protein [Treponema phagedenis]
MAIVYIVISLVLDIVSDSFLYYCSGFFDNSIIFLTTFYTNHKKFYNFVLMLLNII